MSLPRARLCVFYLLLASWPVVAGLRPGDELPEFSETAADGTVWSKQACKGKYIVFEWTNFSCPFVRKHYDSGNMQSLQKSYTEKGVLWFTVSSASPGDSGHLPANEFLQQARTRRSAATAILPDEDGSLGKACSARTSTHMIVINPSGKVIYTGAIDDKATTNLADARTATNYVKAALDADMSGQPVKTKAAKPYGCVLKLPE